MWDDLEGYFDSKNTDTYFFGSMVLIGDNSKREFEIIDGQQRLTSLTLLFVSVKCLLNKVKNENMYNPADSNGGMAKVIDGMIDSLDSIVFNKILFGAMLQEKKVRIERSIGFDYDGVLKAVMECQTEDSITRTLEKADEDEYKICIRYFANHNFFVQKLKEKFLYKGDSAYPHGLLRYEDAVKLNQFIDFLKNRVAVVRILTTKFDIAYQVFEILNNRGLPLSNKDLFRNFLIKEFYESSSITDEMQRRADANEKWRKIEDDYLLDNEFISRYVESKNAQNQRYSAFNDLQAIYVKLTVQSGFKKKIELFYEEISAYLDIYTQILTTNFSQKAINHRLRFILNAGNTTYSLNLLLALFRNEKDPQLVELFLQEYERYMLLTLIGPSKRFSTNPIYESIRYLNAKNFNSALSLFQLTASDKNTLKELLASDFKDNGAAKLLIAKCYWHLDMTAAPDVVGVSELQYDAATLEHIIPQSPDKDTNWEKDFTSKARKELTYKLGNMTLLTQKMNSSVKNYDFATKKVGTTNKKGQKTNYGYEDTRFPFTTELCNIDKIEETHIRERQSRFMSILIEAFGLNA
jgi:uncharacterized protein with ParB-like and HNH nuclease domain